MKRVLSNKWSIMVFVLPTIVFFTYIVTIPIVKTIWYSMLNEIPAIVKENSHFVGLENFITMFTPGRRNDFPGAVVNSMMYAGVSCLVQLPFSLFIALLVASNVKGENVYRNIYFIPVVISSVVVSMLWQRIYKDILPAGLSLFGIPEPRNGFLANKDTKMWAVFIPSLWQYVGYHMLLMYGALRSIPTDVIEAATVDGASGPRLAWSIQIPMIKPMLKVCLSFSLIGSFKLFDTPWVLLGRDAKDLPALYMYVTMFSGHKYSLASAAAVFIVLECLVFTVLLNILFAERKDKYERELYRKDRKERKFLNRTSAPAAQSVPAVSKVTAAVPAVQPVNVTAPAPVAEETVVVQEVSQAPAAEAVAPAPAAAQAPVAEAKAAPAEKAKVMPVVRVRTRHDPVSRRKAKRERDKEREFAAFQRAIKSGKGGAQE